MPKKNVKSEKVETKESKLDAKSIMSAGIEYSLAGFVLLAEVITTLVGHQVIVGACGPKWYQLLGMTADDTKLIRDTKEHAQAYGYLYALAKFQTIGTPGKKWNRNEKKDPNAPSGDRCRYSAVGSSVEE